jgi:hypothetical protein
MGKGKHRPRPGERPPAEDARKNPPEHPLHVPIKVSFRYYEPGERYCLSGCERDEVRAFMDSLRVLTTMTWVQVRSQGGKPGNKTGLAYTTYEDHLVRAERPNISPELRIAGIRAGGKMRIYGVAIENVFHILWFDRNHEIVEG